MIPVIDGYDPTTCSAEEIEAARQADASYRAMRCACGSAPAPNEHCGSGTYSDPSGEHYVCGYCWTGEVLGNNTSPTEQRP